jgi:sulfite exporter TauE/SafE
MNEVLFFLSTAGTVGTLGLGFFIGLKHAIEADHLAAVSTIVSERKSLWSSAFVGGLWGLGHTISLFIVGLFVLLMNFQISEQAERILEFAVGVMLVLLGLNVFRKILRGGHLHFHEHEHDGRTHAHPHIHEPGKVDENDSHHGFKFSPRSLVVGMIHGLAGSAALMLAIIPTIESRVVGLLYIIVFGVGSIGGMMLMSLLVGLPFHLTARNFNRLNNALQSLAGFISIAVGVFIIYEKSVVEGLMS